MDSIQIILPTVIAFNLLLVVIAIILIAKSRAHQKDLAKIKKQQIINQGKIIAAQENLLQKKEELLEEKEYLLDEYRKSNDQ